MFETDINTCWHMNEIDQRAHMLRRVERDTPSRLTGMQGVCINTGIIDTFRLTKAQSFIYGLLPVNPNTLSYMCSVAACLAGHIDWTCVNILSGAHDPYSEDAAKAFQIAAKNENMETCAVSYTAKADTMASTIGRLTASTKCGCSVCRCRVNVVFGQPSNLTSLLFEASKQHYKGEWIIGHSEFGSFDDVVKGLTHMLPDSSSVHKTLRGMVQSQYGS